MRSDFTDKVLIHTKVRGVKEVGRDDLCAGRQGVLRVSQLQLVGRKDPLKMRG